MLKIALPAMAAFSLLCACSSHSHTITGSDGSTVTVDSKGKDEGSVHVTGKDGASVDINTGKPITDYPSDAPLYEGKSVMDMKAASKNARVVAITTPDSVEKISDFYKAGLESKGWKTENTMSSGQVTMFTAAKDNREMVISISSDGKLQTVSQTLTDK